MAKLGEPRASWRRSAIQGLLAAVAVFGAVSTAFAVSHLRSVNTSMLEDVAVLASAFTVPSPWSLRLPSGAQWRPAIALATAGMFLRRGTGKPPFRSVPPKGKACKFSANQR